MVCSSMRNRRETAAGTSRANMNRDGSIRRRGMWTRRRFVSHPFRPFRALPDGTGHRRPDAHHSSPGQFLSGGLVFFTLRCRGPLLSNCQRRSLFSAMQQPPASEKEQL